MSDMEFHEAANIFPLDEDNLAALAADIKQHGLQVPIETLGGKIIDGRRRFKACEIAGVDPEFREVEVADPIAYVLSLNLHRRHLSPTQLAMVGARARQCYDERARERQKEGQDRGRKAQKGIPVNLPESKVDARDAVGEAVGVCGKSIDSASRVIKNGTPALIAAVDADLIAVSTAAKASTMPEEVQDEMAERARESAAKGRGPRARPSAVVAEEKEDEPEAEPNGELKGVGVFRAHEAINSLIRIPKNDALRKQGFRLVTDWIKRNP